VMCSGVMAALVPMSPWATSV